MENKDLSNPSKKSDLDLPYLNTSITLSEFIEKQMQIELKIKRDQELKRQSELEAAREKDRAKYALILSQVNETIAKNKETLESTSNSIAKLQNTIEGMKALDKKFQDFQNDFNCMWGTALNNLFGTFEDLDHMRSEYGVPRVANVEDIVKFLSLHRIAIITGAGVSAESGVFVYKDNEDVVDIGGNRMGIQEAMNIKVFESHPLEFWRYIQESRDRINRCRPCSAHHDLSFMVKHCGKCVSLVTQNIDGFDKELLQSSPNLFEIHGNIHEMRCSQNCTNTLTPTPPPHPILHSPPTCPHCTLPMRPNVLLYGESYSEALYRSNSAKSACLSSDLP